VTFDRSWAGLLALVVLIGLVGGLGIGAIAGARRTQSSFPAFLAHTNASDLGLGTAIDDPPLGFTAAYDPRVVAKITRLPLVKQIADFTVVDPNITPLGHFQFHFAPGESPPTIGGSLDGQFSTMDRVTLTSGRLADPHRANEVVMSAGAARELGMRVGSVLPVGFFTNAQLTLPGCCSANGTGKLAPHLTVNLKLVGIVAVSFSIVEDDIDALGDNWVLLGPTLMRELMPCCAFYTQSTIRVDGGRRNAPVVLGEITRAVPGINTISSTSASFTSDVVATAERSIAPESIAVGVFGAIAVLAALVIAAQMIGRQLRLGADDRAVLRALGASPPTTASDGLLGVLGAVVCGALLACAVAVGISPLAPLGPVRRVFHPGVAFDWTVLGLGFAGLLVVLGAIAVAIAYRQAPHRTSRRDQRRRSPRSRASHAASNAGLPAPAVTGIRFALEPGAGPSAIPVRSTIVGAVVAIVVVTSTLTFGTSLKTLVSHPPLYGWNWNYMLLSGFGANEDLPLPQVTALLDHDPYVSAWSGVYFGDVTVNGRRVPVIAASPNATVAPPLLTGHGLDQPNEIVFGATTLAELHKHVGDTVQVNAGHKRAVPLRIVGTATLPAIGTSGNPHTTMGTGAMLDYQLIPANQRNVQGSPIPGPNAILIRIHRTTNPTAALHSLQQINNTINTPKGGGGDNAGGVVGVLRPAEIVNYRSMGTTPALLGAALAVGATAALALTLIASVRRRRRELALLKAIGFTSRQLAAVVAWQSTIAVTVGVVIGVPLGIIVGRTLWDLFARAIHAVPQPTIGTTTVALVAIGALVLANVVAAIPGVQAARTRTALLLHAE